VQAKRPPSPRRCAPCAASTARIHAAWDARHPAGGMADARLRLVALAAAHPEPAVMRTALAALGLGDALQISFSVTPRGPVTM
jgi:hypothetical protein